MTKNITPNAFVSDLRHTVIGLSAVNEAISQIKECYNGANDLGNPRGLCITGESGTGKSTILTHIFEKTYPSRRMPEGLKMPVVYCKSSPNPTVKRLAEDILVAMGDPAASSGTEANKTYRIKTLMKEVQTKILMIDEFQHFVDQGRKKLQYHVADWLKILVDDAKISLIVAGLPYCTEVIYFNPQLVRRFQSQIKLPRFDWGVSEHREEFIGFIANMEDRIKKYISIPEISNEDLAFRFYYASGGIISNVSDILISAVERAKWSNKYSIDMLDLDAACKKAIFDLPNGNSPFDKKISFTPTVEQVRKIMNRGTTQCHPDFSASKPVKRKSRKALLSKIFK